jgi:hypothetical protein
LNPFVLVTELLIAGLGCTVKVTLSVCAVHGPVGSFVVRVNITGPEYPDGGVYVAVSVFSFGEKEPPATLELHVANDAPPLIVPVSAAVVVPKQILAGFVPASTVAGG